MPTPAKGKPDATNPVTRSNKTIHQTGDYTELLVAHKTQMDQVHLPVNVIDEGAVSMLGR